MATKPRSEFSLLWRLAENANAGAILGGARLLQETWDGTEKWERRVYQVKGGSSVRRVEVTFRYLDELPNKKA